MPYHNIVVPEEHSHLIVLTEIVNKEHDHFAIVILGRNLNPQSYNCREHCVIHIDLYMKKDQLYSFEKSLESLAFASPEEAYNFLLDFREMSALDLLLKMHGPADLLIDNRQLQ